MLCLGLLLGALNNADLFVYILNLEYLPTILGVVGTYFSRMSHGLSTLRLSGLAYSLSLDELALSHSKALCPLIIAQLGIDSGLVSLFILLLLDLSQCRV